MDIRKKLLSIVGVLALTMSMGAGIVAAQDVETSSGATVSVTVACGTVNAGTTTWSLGLNPAAASLNLGNYDPSGTATTSSTEQKALRLSMDIAPCERVGWSFSATISDFKVAAPGTATILGSGFSLPSGELDASEMATAAGGPVSNVVGPVNDVTFLTAGGTDVEGRALWTGSAPIASHTGTTPATGAMYMDYTGVLSGLAPTIAPGTYTAEITVSFTPGQP